MKETNKMRTITAIAVIITITLFTASCSNDAFFGFDDQNDLEENDILNYSYFIEWDSVLFSDSNYKLDSRKNELIIEAINRVGVYKQNGLYTFKYKTAQQVGISEELYSYIYERFSYTNKILREINTKVKKKNSNREGSFPNVRKDCFVFAISGYSNGTIDYVQAYKFCIWAWPTLEMGGYPLVLRDTAFNYFHLPYQVVYSLNSTTELQNAVVTINGQLYGNSGLHHYVNGMTYLHIPNGEDLIDYHDYQNGGSYGYVGISDVIDIYKHP